jgi:hypothetical protein
MVWCFDDPYLIDSTAAYFARRAAQKERVRILYRRALKDTLNWAVHRHIFYRDVSLFLRSPNRTWTFWFFTDLSFWFLIPFDLRYLSGFWSAWEVQCQPRCGLFSSPFILHTSLFALFHCWLLKCLIIRRNGNWYCFVSFNLVERL